MSGTATVPPTTGPLTVREFFDGVRAGRLVVQRCAVCQALGVPPKAVCAVCEGTAWDRTALRGDGEIASYTVIRVPPRRLLSEAPYAIAVVRMAEGVSLLGRMVGVAPDDVRVGLAVRFTPPDDPAMDPPVVLFRPR